MALLVMIAAGQALVMTPPLATVRPMMTTAVGVVMSDKRMRDKNLRKNTNVDLDCMVTTEVVKDVMQNKNVRLDEKMVDDFRKAVDEAAILPPPVVEAPTTEPAADTEPVAGTEVVAADDDALAGYLRGEWRSAYSKAAAMCATASAQRQEAAAAQRAADKEKLMAFKLAEEACVAAKADAEVTFTQMADTAALAEKEANAAIADAEAAMATALTQARQAEEDAKRAAAARRATAEAVLEETRERAAAVKSDLEAEMQRVRDEAAAHEQEMHIALAKERGRAEKAKAAAVAAIGRI